MKTLKSFLIVAILATLIGTVSLAQNNDSNLIEIQDYDIENQIIETSYISDAKRYEYDLKIFSEGISKDEGVPSTRSIIGTDDRNVITNTKKAPYKFIGKLVIEYSDGKSFGGTGFLVGNSSLVTAAHCVYDASHGGYPKKVTFYPGKTGSSNPYGSTTAKAIHVPAKYISNGYNYLYDYAVVELKQAIGKSTGYFDNFIGFFQPDNAAYVGNTGIITGYNGTTLYKAKGNTKVYVKEKKITYPIDTDSGQSGAPIYSNNNGQFAVYGIHILGGKDYNTGRYISDEVANLIVKYS